MIDHPLMKIYPRVLLVNVEPISEQYATGITMGNLFRGWPLECIAQIYVDDSVPNNIVCKKSFKLNFEDLKMPGLIKHKYRSIQKSKAVHVGRENIAYINNNDFYINGQIIRFFKKIVLHILDFSSYNISEELHEFIEKYKPDYIYSTLSCLKILKLVYKIQDEFHIPVIPHFMDDWINTLYRGPILDKLLNIQLKKITMHIISNAPLLFVIGDLMAIAYKKRYNRDFLSFMNCIELVNYEKTEVTQKTNNFKLIYTGSLHLNRWKPLLEIGETLDILNKEGILCSLDIYGNIQSSDIADKIMKISSLNYIGNISPIDILTHIKSADGALHIESFDENQIPYTRYSISTKIPEYLSVGQPIFAYGPKELASIKYIEENLCGTVVNVHDKNQLLSKLKDFVLNIDLRNELGKNAIQLANNNHSAILQRERFRLAFANVFSNNQLSS
jgi:hypothetical protein